MAEHDNDGTASLHDIFAAIGDVLSAIGDGLAAAGDQLWNEPIDWEWAFYEFVEVALTGGVIMAGYFILVLAWLALRRLWRSLADHVPWLRIRRRTRRVARGGPAEAPPRPKGDV